MLEVKYINDTQASTGVRNIEYKPPADGNLLQ